MAGGLQRLGKGKEAVDIALEEHALKEASAMKTKNNYLSVIGVVSPMLGLLGAVLGMIKAFKAIGEGTALQDPTKLAAAIGEVLVATAFGLFIAVPAFFAFYFFRNRAQATFVALQDAVTTLVDRLPYGELQGIKIGDDLETELRASAAPAPAVAAVAAAPAPVAAAAAPQVNCPNCNNPIAQGASPCPSCGAQIQWS
jgi:biopolymer transport protein ExbB